MELSGSTILVTGGAGLVGSTIVDQLLAADPTLRVVILDNMSRGTPLNIEAALASGRA